MVEGLIATSKSGGDFLQLANGYYLFQFLGIEDAGQFDNFDKTGKVDKIHMNYAVYDHQTRQPYIIPPDQPKAGEHGVFQNLVNKSGHTKSTLHVHATEVVGRAINDGEDIGVLLAAAVGTFVVVQMGLDQNNKPGKLKNMMPDMPVGVPVTAAAVAPVLPTVPTTAAPPVAAPVAVETPAPAAPPVAVAPAPPTPPAPPAPPAPPTA